MDFVIRVKMSSSESINYLSYLILTYYISPDHRLHKLFKR